MEDAFGSIIGSILINIASEEIRELIHRLLSGEALPPAYAASFEQLAGILGENGIDIEQFGDAEWASIAEMLTTA